MRVYAYQIRSKTTGILLSDTPGSYNLPLWLTAEAAMDAAERLVRGDKLPAAVGDYFALMKAEISIWEGSSLGNKRHGVITWKRHL